ncbi:MAG: hypothetical protein M0R17_08070 [Candidatus Omnitrophica bacterium]|jgi:hypothetical protein|nr:hypothetical protein [Candidatus Omnitrophota bacterium]
MKLINASKEEQIKAFTNFLKKRRVYNAFIKGFKYNLSLPKDKQYCIHCSYTTLNDFYKTTSVDRWLIAGFYWIHVKCYNTEWVALYDLWRNKLEKEI